MLFVSSGSRPSVPLDSQCSHTVHGFCDRLGQRTLLFVSGAARDESFESVAAAASSSGSCGGQLWAVNARLEVKGSQSGKHHLQGQARLLGDEHAQYHWTGAAAALRPHAVVLSGLDLPSSHAFASELALHASSMPWLPLLVVSNATLGSAGPPSPVVAEGSFTAVGVRPHETVLLRLSPA